MAKNDFKAFATGENANTLSQEEYESLGFIEEGFKSGIARSEQLNKVWRQSSIIAAVIGKYIAEKTGEDVIDDGDLEKLVAQLDLALKQKITAEIPDASLVRKGISQLNNATNSDREDQAATPKAVNDVRKMAEGKLSSVADATLSQKGIVQLSSATDSANETLAATPRAVNDVRKMAEGKLSSVADATLSQKGIVQLSSATDSAHETLAATPRAVKGAYDFANTANVAAKNAHDEANRATDNANSRLAKNQNGVDIPNKSEFIKNLGLVETVELAKNAVPSSRKINGKVLSGDVSLNAGDVGAFPDFRSYVSDNSRFSDTRESGIYCVAIDNPNSVTDLPAYNGSKIYAYGFLSVFKSNDQRIHQTYYSHQGDIATRQTWDGPERYKPWTTQYSTANPAIPVGVPLPYPHRYTPVGYLTCNGQTFDKSLYPMLAKAYPGGNVPDLRGEFIRGWDDGRGVDRGRVCGSWQEDALQNITGGFQARLMDGYSQFENFDGALNATRNSSSGLYACYPSNKQGADIVTFDASRVARTANETRPRNIAFNYIVRAA